MTSLTQRLVILVLRRQGRKKRWSDGATLVETARTQHRTGSPRPPKWLKAHVTLTTDDAAGFAVHTLSAQGVERGAPTVLYLHGGGYIHSFSKQHWQFVSGIVMRTGATVLAAQYPLAPEHTWRDCFDPLLEIARSVDIVMGDSAGGGLALALVEALAAEGVARDAVLVAPALDMTMSDPATAQYDARDPWLAADGLVHCGQAWAGDDDPRRLEVSPLFGAREGIGRVLVFSGTRDVLHPQALDLARRLPQTQLVVSSGSVHNYPLLPIPEARPALAAIDAFLGVKRSSAQ